MSVRMPEKRDLSRVSNVPLPIPGPQLRQLPSLIAAIISAQTGVPISRQALRLTRDRAQVVLPPRDELEQMRSRRSPMSAPRLVSCDPIPIPVPRRWKGYVPEPIPRAELDRFASFLAEVISESTEVRMSRGQVNLIGENGKVALPPRDELERMQSGRTPVNVAVLVSATPINIP
jgi:hypothetical protein